MGCFAMPKGIPNKRYTPEFKKQVIETMLEEKLSYSETARRFDVSNHHRIQDWERIYLTEGPEGFAVERRGRKRKGSLNKVKELQTEYAKLLEEKKKIYAEYRRSREEMRELLTAKANVDRLLKMDEEQKQEKEKDHHQR